MRYPIYERPRLEKTTTEYSYFVLVVYVFIDSFIFSHTSIFQLLDKPAVTDVVPFLPPVLAFNYYRAFVGSSNPTARRLFIECC